MDDSLGPTQVVCIYDGKARARTGGSDLMHACLADTGSQPLHLLPSLQQEAPLWHLHWYTAPICQPNEEAREF